MADADISPTLDEDTIEFPSYEYFLNWLNAQSRYDSLTLGQVKAIYGSIGAGSFTKDQIDFIVKFVKNEKTQVKPFVPSLGNLEEGVDSLYTAIAEKIRNNETFLNNPDKKSARLTLADELHELFRSEYEKIRPTDLSILDLEELPVNSYIFNTWSEDFVQVFVKMPHGDIRVTVKEYRWYSIQSLAAGATIDQYDGDPYNSWELGKARHGETPFTLLVRGHN